VPSRSRPATTCRPPTRKARVNAVCIGSADVAMMALPTSRLTEFVGPITRWRELMKAAPKMAGTAAAYKPAAGGRPAMIA
jgi:hypothetical protein